MIDPNQQVLLLPEPMHFLLARRYALIVFQVRPRATETVQWVRACVCPQRGPECYVGVGRCFGNRCFCVGGAGDPNCSARQFFDIFIVSTSMSTAPRLSAGSKSSPSYLAQRILLELGVCVQAFETAVLLAELRKFLRGI